jgi:hypothetical protein
MQDEKLPVQQSGNERFTKKILIPAAKFEMPGIPGIIPVIGIFFQKRDGLVRAFV